MLSISDCMRICVICVMCDCVKCVICVMYDCACVCVAPLFGHVGDGNFHVSISYNAEEQRTAEELAVRMAR